MILILHRGELKPLYQLLEQFERNEEVILLLAKEKITEVCLPYLQKIKSMVHGVFPIENYDNSSRVEYEVYCLSRKYKITALFAIAEFDLYRAERIKKWLNLSYIEESVLELFRNKMSMKNYFTQQGIKTSRYSAVKSVLDIYDFVEKYGFPVVVKQQEGGGGVGTRILKSMQDIAQFARSDFRVNGYTEPNLMIESYVQGKLYHIDGVCYNQKILYLSCGAYIHGMIEDFDAGLSLGSVLIPNHLEIYQKLYQAQQNIIQAVQLSGAFSFHTEYFIDENGQMILCETACRTGGALINQTNAKIRNMDINLWLLNTLYQHSPYEVNSKNHHTSGGWVIYGLGKRTARVLDIAQMCNLPYVLDYQPKVAIGQTIYPAVSNIQGICGMVFSAENESQALLNYQNICDWVENNFKIDFVS
ncbi:ATP-grasp domain-containing protein [Rappaport israeli]|uniref:ATP-grasp domain-containing protein n=1 Tax=Rappaport israeli TaxID=1839807 RepID=UPI00093192F5|nr:ATP-grasp domain-containing protein [Rappaport israeli]